MLTYIVAFDGQQGIVEFQSQSVYERDVLLKVEQNQPLNTSENMSLSLWMESTLAKFGYHYYSLQTIIGAEHRFSFTVERKANSLTDNKYS